jgi:integrase
MKGYVARKGNQHYAVIYEGLDPVSGRERRRWHPAGPDRAEAEALAVELAAERMQGRSTRRSTLTFGVYLTQRWLPGRRAALRPSTWDSYRRNVDLHVVPCLGRVPLRHLRPEHIERLYTSLLADGSTVRRGGLDAKTVLEIHMVVRRALDDAVRRGLIVSNPAAVAHAPKRRPLASAVPRAWNAQQLRAFFDAVAEHRYRAALWVSANTGMRRSELLGLRWGDVDLDTAQLSVRRSLVSVGYELHESRGKTRTSRRCIDLDARAVHVLRNWKQQRSIEVPNFDGDADSAYVFPRPNGAPTHPHLLSDAFKKIVARSGLPRIRLHDLRHTHATLLLKAGVPIKVVSERLGHSTPGFTMATYQHVLPGMQAEAARTFAALLEDPPDSTR